MYPAIPLSRMLSGLILALVLYQPGSGQAGESRIELSDGSVITGELVGIEDGRYRIRSATLGELWIPESSVSVLQPLNGRAPGAANSASALSHAAEIASIQKRLATDQGLMDQVSALQQDPGIQSALSDPEFVRMVLSGDVKRLSADPRFRQLMTNPAIQSIMGQVIGR